MKKGVVESMPGTWYTTSMSLKLLVWLFHKSKTFLSYRMCKSISNTPFQVHGINKFKKETIKNQKYEKNDCRNYDRNLIHYFYEFQAAILIVSKIQNVSFL